MLHSNFQVFWNETHGCWFDFDVTKNAQIEVFFDTNLFPLFCGCGHDDLDGSRIVAYLTNNGILNYQGIPTSLISSGQQVTFMILRQPITLTVLVGLSFKLGPSQFNSHQGLESNWTDGNR